MWQEARKQEKRIRGMMVDHKKRAERRREYYERIKQDPTQFLQVHGRPAKIHIDATIAAAANAPTTMMPWQGQNDNQIDRFDGRAHLDMIPEYKSVPGQVDSSEDKKEARQQNYERYRILVQNHFLDITEEKFLKTIELEELYGGKTYQATKAKEEKRKNKAQKAAIGFNYDDVGASKIIGPSLEIEPLPPGVSSAPVDISLISSAAKDDGLESEDSDLDLDLSVDIMALNTEQRLEINKSGKHFGLGKGDFIKYLARDIEEAEELKQAKEKEEEKAMFSGRKSRRERRIIRERHLASRVFGTPSYAAKETPTEMDVGSRRGSSSSSSSGSSLNSSTRSSSQSSADFDHSTNGLKIDRKKRRKRKEKRRNKVEFITSFGGGQDSDEHVDEENDDNLKNKKRVEDAKNNLKKLRKQSVMIGPELPPESILADEDVKERFSPFNRRRTSTSMRRKSRREERSRRSSRSLSRGRRNTSYRSGRRSRSRSLRRRRSMSRSRRWRRSRSRSRQISRGRRRSQSPRRRRSRTSRGRRRSRTLSPSCKRSSRRTKSKSPISKEMFSRTTSSTKAKPLIKVDRDKNSSSSSSSSSSNEEDVNRYRSKYRDKRRRSSASTSSSTKGDDDKEVEKRNNVNFVEDMSVGQLNGDSNSVEVSVEKPLNPITKPSVSNNVVDVTSIPSKKSVTDADLILPPAPAPPNIDPRMVVVAPVAPKISTENDAINKIQLLNNSPKKTDIPDPPVRRYYGRNERRRSSSESSDFQDEDDSESLRCQKKNGSSVANRSGSASTPRLITNRTTKLSSSSTPSESQVVKDKIKKRMQAAIKRQLKADQKAAEERRQRLEEERLYREEEMREISLKLRKKERERQMNMGGGFLGDEMQIPTASSWSGMVSDEDAGVTHRYASEDSPPPGTEGDYRQDDDKWSRKRRRSRSPPVFKDRHKNMTRRRRSRSRSRSRDRRSRSSNSPSSFKSGGDKSSKNLRLVDY